MLKNLSISWVGLVLGYITRLAVAALLGGICYFVLGKFMLLMGTPAFWLDEYYTNSPIGIFCGALTDILSYGALGYVIARYVKQMQTVFVTITVFIAIEMLIFLLASGLHVPGYRYVLVTFKEIVIQVFSWTAAYAGCFLVEYPH